MSDDWLSAVANVVAPGRGILDYHDDPAGFARECVKWPQGRRTGRKGGPADYQEEILTAVAERHRVAVRIGRGAGKTTTAALAILWFALTREAAKEDWKCIVTAGGWAQLTGFLWPEVKRVIAPRLDWEKIGRAPFNPETEMMQRELRLPFGAVSLAAPSDAVKIEGAHAEELFYVLDEAKSIPDATWHSIEGAFLGSGADTDQMAYVLASSTAGAPQGVFYEIHDRKPGYEDWHAIHVSPERAIANRRMSAEQIKQRELQFGAQSAWFLQHICAEFAQDATDSVMSLAYVEAAQERWKELATWAPSQELSIPVVPEDPQLGPLDAIGVDLAGRGEDRTIFALRHANVISTLVWRPHQPDPMTPTGEIKALAEQPELQPTLVVDADGLGAPCVARLQEQSIRVSPFIASEKSEAKVRGTGQLFADTRSAAWWHLREALEPEGGMNIALPPDERLLADLLAPTWKTESNGRIRVESKQDIRKRLRRSTDAGDAVVMAFWAFRVAPTPHAPRVLRRPGGAPLTPLRQRAGRF